MYLRADAFIHANDLINKCSLIMCWRANISSQNAKSPLRRNIFSIYFLRLDLINISHITRFRLEKVSALRCGWGPLPNHLINSRSLSNWIFNFFSQYYGNGRSSLCQQNCQSMSIHLKRCQPNRTKSSNLIMLIDCGGKHGSLYAQNKHTL